ncbi:MAG: M56 family metallopeptidase [Muribaculaceae bacterium]|nr:M56 family metallopeptidase [Muribaculaceae bacterium]
MDISFVSFVNTLLFGTIAILLLGFLINRADITSKKCFLFFSFIILMIIIRLCLPVELPLQNNVNITKIWPDIYLAIYHCKITLAGKEIPLLFLLMMISITGSIFCMGRFLLSYSLISRTLKNYKPVNDDMLDRIMLRINREQNRNVRFRLLSSPEITTPFLFHVRSPVIVLPEITLSEEEWYYILSHEMSHYYHKDLWIRLACEGLRIIYWWNPFVYLLQKQIARFQELHIDATVTRNLSEIQKLDYLECLIKLAKLQHSPRKKWIAAFRNETEGELQKRIKRILYPSGEGSPRKKRSVSNVLAVVLLILCTLFLPNLIIFEPYGPIPEDILEGTFSINADNSYLLLTEEGVYDVYVDDEYIATVTQIFDDSLKVIDSKGDIIK